MHVPFRFSTIPESAGVYRYYDKNDKLIYVGKAKNLRKRIKSYFLKTIQNRRIKLMVSQIHRLAFALVDSEFDALLLENNLIKSLNPKYNILLRDDKIYPYIIVTKENFPRVYMTRNKKIKGTFYGPFANPNDIKKVLDVVHKLYPIRTCKYNLNTENVRKKKYKICLEHHIGNCLGPCQQLQSESEYEAMIILVKSILSGKFAVIKKHFKAKMLQAAERLEFENAHAYKQKIKLLNSYRAHSIVDNTMKGDLDVVSIVSDEKYAHVNYLKVQLGAITATHTVEVRKQLDELDVDIMLHTIINFRAQYHSEAKEVITNIDFQTDYQAFEIYKPKIGTKKKLVNLSLKNALFYKKERMGIKDASKREKNKVLEMLQKDLMLDKIPLHIECFDNSNIQGTNPVASMVCFKKGKASKKDYRHFKIKTVEGIDDFASMYEIVSRRYTRVGKEQGEFPNLVVVDGGKGQLSAACQALKDLNLYDTLPIIGIAKRLEEIYFPEDPYPLCIDKKSPSLHLIQQLRDEAHRFAITFHRNLRSKDAIKTELSEIVGVGEKTINVLLRHFKTVEAISKLDKASLIPVIGKEKAEKVYNHFNK